MQSTVVRHKIKNISASNEAMLLKLGRDVGTHATCLVPVPSSLKSNINHLYLHGANTQLEMLKRGPNEGGTGMRLG